MRFHKHVSAEAQELLTEQLKQYEGSIQMTKEEKKGTAEMGSRRKQSL